MAEEKYVLVTTEYRGVFAGFATDTTGETITLRAGRNCLYWSKAMKGFLGLANQGPDSDCRIGPPADIQLRKVTSVTHITPAAQAKWEAFL
jgi:hypothetical protein